MAFAEDTITLISGRGRRNASIAQAYFGKNWQGGFTPVQANDDQDGYVFIGKPDFNLSYENIAANRQLAALMTSLPTSSAAAIRCYLDPRSHRSGAITSTLVDPLSPFISLLENACINLDGFTDRALNEYQSPQGKRGEQHIALTGEDGTNAAFPLTYTGQDIKGNGVYSLIDTWILCNKLMNSSELGPHIANVTKNRWSNQCRIFRVTLDYTRRFVTHINMSGVSAPKTSPTGATFSFDATSGGDINGMKTISTTFASALQFPDDPICIRLFNDLVRSFNPAMGDTTREGRMILVPLEHRDVFCFLGYPRIHPITNEFEVWMDAGIYNERAAYLGLSTRFPQGYGPDGFWS